MKFYSNICDCKWILTVIETGFCECFGDPHCLTFDNYFMSYQGLCKFLLVLLVNSNGNNSPSFAVYVGNIALNAYVSAVRYVEIVYDDHTVHIEGDSVTVRMYAWCWYLCIFCWPVGWGDSWRAIYIDTDDEFELATNVRHLCYVDYLPILYYYRLILYY